LIVPGTYVGSAVSVSGNITAGNAQFSRIVGSSVSASGNISASGTITGTSVVASGNVTAGNISSSGIVTATSAQLGLITGTSVAVTGNISAGNVSTSGAVTATSAQLGLITGTSVTASGNIIASGNIRANTGAFFIGDGGLLSNISGSGNYSNANVASYLPTYTGNVKFGGLVSTQTATADTASVIKAKIPIVVNGVTYFIMLTN
jgi:filamentous hemagglutinin